MLTLPVIVSRQAAYSTPGSRLSASSQVTKSPVAHPLSIHQVTKYFFRNSFLLKTIHFNGGVPPACVSLTATTPSPVYAIPYSLLFKLLRTLLRFFALTKMPTLLFSSDSALCAKKTRGRRGEQLGD